MKFGTVKKNEVEMVRSGDYLRNFKEGETKIRFLNETDEFIMFREHYTVEGKSFPCLQDSPSCPGCSSEIESVRKSSRKYAVNVLMVDSGYVNAVKMPVTLVNRVVTRSERNGGTIINRDYVIYRTGKGLETEYDVEQDEKYPVEFAQYDSSLKDINAILVTSFEEICGPVSDYEVSKKPKVAEKAEPTASEITKAKPAKTAQEAKEDFLSKSTSNSGHVDEEEIDESAVRAMTINQLVVLAGRANLDISKAETREEMVELLISELS
jgi:hypothetical protein